jgi:predicted nuclease of predicted toxin-antitoxin system
MPRFLIDVNLPYYFSLWHGESFVHQHDLGDEWTDEQIWEYAKQHDLVIITKDSDFSHRVIFHTPPPKVIHIRFGNVKMKQFFGLLTTHWPQALSLIENHKLVSIYFDRVEAIG